MNAFSVAFGGKADMTFCNAECLLMTQSGHLPTELRAFQSAATGCYDANPDRGLG